jgi:hypothetical protein
MSNFTPPPEEPSPSLSSRILKLNIGGTKFTTTYATIYSVDSMLSAMFSGRHALTPDAKGFNFIDRDGTHFRHILNLLRFPTEFIVHLSEGDRLDLEVEVRYYGLSEAYEAVRQIRIPVITATSAGHYTHTRDPPNYKAFFTVGDKVLPASKRGWNVLLFDPTNSEIISQTWYDIWGHPNEVQKYKTFLDNVPAGIVVAVAVFDESGERNTSMYQYFPRVLHSCGGGDTRVESRASFAIVGVKGWQQGRAVEAYDAGGVPVTATGPTTIGSKW